MPDFKHSTFIGGEVSPEIYPRIELEKRQTGVKLCRNFTVDRFGSVSNRGGLEYVASTKNSADKIRLIRFVLNKDISYILELGEGYMRIYKDKAQHTASSISAWSNVSEYFFGDIISYLGSNYSSMIDDNVNNQPDITSTYWHLLTDDVIELSAPWSLSDLFELNYAQSGNFIRLANNNYPVYEIERISDEKWGIQILQMYSSIPWPEYNAVAGGAGTIVTNYKVTSVSIEGEESLAGFSLAAAVEGVSPKNNCFVLFQGIHGYSVNDEVMFKNIRMFPQLNGKIFKVDTVPTAESLTLFNTDATGWVASGTSIDIISATATNPVRITTSDNHGFTTGREVYIHSSGMTQINDSVFTITKISDTVFDLNGENGLAYTPAVDGVTSLTDFEAVMGTAAGLAGQWGQGVNTQVSITGSIPTAVNPNVITVKINNFTANIPEFNVYKEINGVFGFIGTTVTNVFNDEDIIPDTSKTPQRSLNIFNSTDDYPAAISHYQQRLCVGNTRNNVELFKTSRTGDVYNFTRRTPIQDDDPVSFALRGRDVSEIRHIVDLDNLVILTEGGEWIVKGDQSGSLIPTAPNPKQGSFRGASSVRPIIIGTTCIYVQNRDGSIRDLQFEINQNGYVGTDLTEFVSHLFDGKNVVDWAYQQIPNSIIWAILDDGSLVGLTYIPERSVWAWHRHDSNGGYFESIVGVPENGKDYIYFSIKRTINGSDIRHIERLNARNITSNAIDAIFLDSSVTIDGRNTSSTTMALTTGTDWTALQFLTLTASAAHFVAGDVGKYRILRASSTVWDEDLGENVTVVSFVKCLITAFTSNVIVTVQPETDVPIDLQGIAVTDWGSLINIITGLTHLEGEVVSALGDGNDVSGYDSDEIAIASMTVTGGQITLPNGQFYEVIHVGTRYFADLETLDIDIPNQQTLQNKVKRVNEVTILTTGAVDFNIGKDPDSMVNTSDTKTSYLSSGKFELRIPANWNDNGRVFIRHDKPLPLTIVSLIASGEAEGIG